MFTFITFTLYSVRRYSRMSSLVMFTGTRKATLLGSRYEPDWCRTKFCHGKKMFRGILGGDHSTEDPRSIRKTATTPTRANRKNSFLTKKSTNPSINFPFYNWSKLTLTEPSLPPDTTLSLLPASRPHHMAETPSLWMSFREVAGPSAAFSVSQT